MSKSITFFYDFLSPYTYLAQTQLDAILGRTGAHMVYKPMSVLKVMELVGNQPTTIMSPAKGAYAFKDLRRWAARYAVPISSNPHLIETNNDLLLRGSLASIETEQAAAYNKAIFEALWTQGAKLVARDDVAAVLAEASLTEVTALLDKADEPTSAEKLAANNQEAADAGVFGSPSFIANDELYFGNDRLDFLEAALAEGATE